MMKKSFTIITFLLIVLISTNVFAATASAVDTTMEIVEDNVCTIELNDEATFEKKIISSKLDEHQITLQLKVTNNSQVTIPTGEMMLVIDSSQSMDTEVSENTTRKDVVLDSANKLVESLLKENSSLKIGVVTFSTATLEQPDLNTTRATSIGTIADAQKVCDLTSDLSTLTNSISSIEGTGQFTNLDSGLQLAKSCFSSEDNNKYMIILTDGLPNVAVGNSDLVTYDGLTDIINRTKSTLTSLQGIDVYTVLTGIENEEATFRQTGEDIYTYGDVIRLVFGTEEAPTIGKFYNIQDEEIADTITNKIYNDLMPQSKSLKDITIVDYFPQYIVDNFEMAYVEGIDVSNVSTEIDPETNSITWHIDKLASGETAFIQYHLTLKDEYDASIIDKNLDTNEKVDITFKDFDDQDQEKTSDVTPVIKVTVPEDPDPDNPDPEEPKPEDPKPEDPKPENPPVDNTIAPDPLPDAGNPILIGAFIVLIGAVVFFGYKVKKYKF